MPYAGLRIFSRNGGRSLFCCLLLVLQTSFAQGQLPVTQLRSLFPPGGQAGTVVTVDVIEGDDLDELSGLVFNHPEITVVNPPDPLSNPRRFSVQIPEQIPAGYYSVRALGRFGLSNARMFRVESLPTVAYQEAELAKGKPQPSTLNTIIYSRIEAAGDFDEFVYELPANVAIQASLDALAIDSRLTPVLEIYDPQGHRLHYARQQEWDDPRIAFVTPAAGLYRVRVTDFLFKGAVNYSYRLSLRDQLQPVALLPPAIPQEEIQSVTTLKPTQAALKSNIARQSPEQWTQEAATWTLLDQNAPHVLPGFQSPRQSYFPPRSVLLKSEQTTPELVALSPASAPLFAEQEPNNLSAEAQQLTYPCEVYGQFQTADDVDIFQVAASKGSQLWLQVIAQRDGQALDPFLSIVKITQDAQGKESRQSIVIPDDLPTNLYPTVFDTLTDDTDFLLSVAEDATYQISVRNRYLVADADQQKSYRLKITPPQPDFEAVALVLPNVTAPFTADTPSGCVLRKGGTATLKVLLHRLQGFSESVRIDTAEPVPGITISPLLIPAGATAGELILHAEADAAPGIAELKLLATAVSAQEQAGIAPEPAKIRKPVTPATIVWKSDTINPAVSRLGHSVMVSVLDESLPFTLTTSPHPAWQHVCQGQQIWQEITVTRQTDFAETLTFAAEGLDKNSKIQVTVPAIAKEETRSLVRYQFPADAVPGWHVNQLKLSTSLNYVRNPQLLARQEEQYQAQEKQLAETKTELATIQTAITQQQKNNTDLTQDTAALQTEQTATAKQLETLKQQQTELESLAATAPAETLPEIQAKLTVVTKDREATVKKQEALQAQIQADQAKIKQGTETLTALQTQQKKLTDLQTALTTQLANLKKTLDKTRADQKPKALKQEALLDRQAFFVHKAPFMLTLKSPAEQTLKRGATQEVQLEVARVEGVTGEIQLQLTLPPGVAGVDAEPFTLASDQTTASLKLTSNETATLGKHLHCTIRGTIQAESLPLSVDVPFAIQVTE